MTPRHDQQLQQPASPWRPYFDGRITLGNVLIIIGGIFAAVVVVVNLKGAYDELDKGLALLSYRLNVLSDDVALIKRALGKP